MAAALEVPEGRTSVPVDRLGLFVWDEKAETSTWAPGSDTVSGLAKASTAPTLMTAGCCA